MINWKFTAHVVFWHSLCTFGIPVANCLTVQCICPSTWKQNENITCEVERMTLSHVLAIHVCLHIKGEVMFIMKEPVKH